MKKLKCLVVDDKPLAIDILTDYISKTPFLGLAATANNPIEALEVLKKDTIDLVFLDIQMPELNGLNFIKIAGGGYHFILTTAYSKYALEGFEHDVVDYLLKPISYERFYRAAEKVRQQAQADLAPVAEPVPEYLFIKTEYRIQKVDFKNILYIEALQNYVAINAGKEKILSLLTMKKIEEQLPKKDFVRVHKSFIVALRHIVSIERNRIFIGGAIIPVGENYRDNFFTTINPKP